MLHEKTIIWLIVFVLILPYLNTQAKNLGKINYTSQVVLDISWDKEPEKLGRAYFWRGDGEPVPPEQYISFIVSPNGDIYLVDRVYHKVLRFDPAGNFLYAIDSIEPDRYNGICVDTQDNIYVSCGHVGLVESQKDILVKKYSSKGELLRTYHLLKPEEIEPCLEHVDLTIHIDDHGSLYAQYGTEVTLQFEAKDKELPVQAQKNSCVESVLGGNFLSGNRFYKDFYWSNGGGGILISDSTGNKLKIFKQGGGYFLGADQMNNLYFYSRRLLWEDGKIYPLSEEMKGKRVDVVEIYDEHENPISSFYWTNPQHYAANTLYSEWVTIEQSNVYVLIVEENGIKIVKWSPVERGK